MTDNRQAATVYEILVEGPFRRDQVIVEHAAQYDLHLDADASRSVGLEWRKRKQHALDAGITLYDGALWRVGAYTRDSHGLRLYVGTTSYREYVGTRQPSFFAGRRRAELANPLGICCAIVTVDGQVMVARRSGVDVASGQFSTPGGFVEREDTSDPFVAMARELREELDLNLDPQEIVCTGLIYDLRHPHYELCFAARVALTLVALRGLHPVEPEADILRGVPDDAESIAAFVDQNKYQMSPSGAACLALYARRRSS